MKQNTPEWFAARKSRITGSMVGAILGLNPWMTSKQAMRAKVREYHGLPQEIDKFTQDVIFSYGHQMEPLAVLDFELETGLDTQECGFFEYEDWLGASPDRLIGDNAILEVKCPWSKRKEGTFEPCPDYYYAQVQIELLCSERSLAYFYQWSANVTPKLEKIEIDNEWLETNLPKLRAFYDKFLIEREHLERYQTLELDTPLIQKLIYEWDDLKIQEDLTKARKAEIIAELEKHTGGQNAILGMGRKFTKVVPAKGNVDWAKVQKTFDIDVEPYRKKPGAGYWKLT